jgi:hypothetical protein
MNFSGPDRGRTWEAKVAAFETSIRESGAYGAWPGPDVLCHTVRVITENLHKDIEDIKHEAAFIFSTDVEKPDLTKQNVELLRRWYSSARPPSMVALCIAAIEILDLFPPEDFLQSVLMAGVLGEAENDLDYHNNMHYRKVLLQAIRLIVVHNNIYSGTKRAFDAQQVALLLMASCIHDFGHDGMGNTIKGVFEQGRLERQSHEWVMPFLKSTGLDESALTTLRTMILCTEVTPLDDPANPMNQMKAAYRYHFLGDKTRTHTLNLDPSLAVLQQDPALTMMSLILHEADIATSAGLTYEITKYETSIYMREIKHESARPQHVIDFLNQVCSRRILSDAGQKLYAANMARIFALAEEDVKDGDEPFPHSEQSEFLRVQPDAAEKRDGAVN